MEIPRDKVALILTSAFALTLFAHGIQTPVGVATITTVTLIIGVASTFFDRFSNGRPIVSLDVLRTPVAMASICYFGLGLLSVVVAENKFYWIKEVVQRTIIIFLPMLLFSMAPRKPEDLRFAILSYLPLCAIIVLFTVYDAHHNGLSEATYTLGMHKNHIAGSCSVMATIAIAGMLTTNQRKRRLTMLGFLAASVIGCIASQGKAGVVCILVATTFMFIAAKAKPRNIVYFVVSVVIIGAIAWQILPEKAKDHVVSTKKFSTNEIRMTLWTDVLPVLIHEPFNAVGWGNPLIRGVNYYGDCANVLMYDWMQLSIVGAISLVSIIVLAIAQALDNARRMPTRTLLSFINLVALGVVCGRFTHANLDTFWIGRGVTLTTWAAIGMLIFVKLYLDQTSRHRPQQVSLSKPRSGLNHAKKHVLR